MSDVLNRTTKEFRRSVNDPDFPPAAWIIEPMVGGQRMRFWIDPSQRKEPRYVNISGDTVTEMTEAEKDAVDAANAAASEVSERETGKSFLNANMPLRAFVGILIDEINILRNRAYGGLFRDAAVTSQSVPNNVFTTLNALTGSTAMPVGGGVVADTVAGNIVLPTAGDYMVRWSLSFSGDNNTEFTFAAFGGGTRAPGTTGVRALGTGGAAGIGNVSASGIVNAPVDNVPLTLRAFHSEGTPKNLTVEAFQLWVTEVTDLPDRTMAQLKTALEARIDTLNSVPGGL